VQFLESEVTSRVPTTCLVHWIRWVSAIQEIDSVGKTEVTADRDKIKFRLFNPSSTQHWTTQNQSCHDRPRFQFSLKYGRLHSEYTCPQPFFEMSNVLNTFVSYQHNSDTKTRLHHSQGVASDMKIWPNTCPGAECFWTDRVVEENPTKNQPVHFCVRTHVHKNSCRFLYNWIDIHWRGSCYTNCCFMGETECQKIRSFNWMKTSMKTK